MSPAELKKPIVNHVQALLRPMGYRKAGSVFSRNNQDVVQLIEIQSSRNNTDFEARFTVNVGVFAPGVVYEDVRDTTKPSISAGHWHWRLGSLSPEKRDIWWSVNTSTEADVAAQDICSRLSLYGLPALAAVPNLQALIEIWKAGEGPGLTEYQRKDYLARVSAGGGTRSAF